MFYRKESILLFLNILRRNIKFMAQFTLLIISIKYINLTICCQNIYLMGVCSIYLNLQNSLAYFFAQWRNCFKGRRVEKTYLMLGSKDRRSRALLNLIHF